MSEILTQRIIGDALAARLITDVRKSWPELTDDLGARGVAQLEGYLRASASSVEPLTPSLPVDLFWHALLLRTRDYADVCELVAGGPIHHVPDDAEGCDPRAGREAIGRTKEAMRAVGVEPDADLWPGEGSAECSQCHAGCSDSPNGPKK
ncbi:glycine-rich domain-containing protein [Streptomyces lonarensis]|uniref:glycine-rich domain-containing protein n=1 Tax=Streptomyces lonarensis TaxID=700599 RepID=UPI0028A8E9ED|nr:hypothetical protein [Streptomyces lonarensis]